MHFPIKGFLCVDQNSKEFDELNNEWRQNAIRLSLYHGIYIAVIYDIKDNSTIVKHICFQVGEHTFENLKDLKRALKMKTLL